MAKNEERIKFIELRAFGFSYDKIKVKIGVSKQTLINWNKQYLPMIKAVTELREHELYSEIRAKRVMFSTLLINKLEDLYISIIDEKINKLSFKDKIQMIFKLENLLCRLTDFEKIKNHRFEEELKNEEAKVMLDTEREMMDLVDQFGPKEAYRKLLYRYSNKIDDDEVEPVDKVKE